jgi:hypothetical protein
MRMAAPAGLSGVGGSQMQRRTALARKEQISPRQLISQIAARSARPETPGNSEKEERRVATGGVAISGEVQVAANRARRSCPRFASSWSFGGFQPIRFTPMIRRR